MPSTRSKETKNGQKKTNSGEDAVSLLKSDHVQVKRMLKQLHRTGEEATDEREQLLAQIERELKTHTQIEEEIFYPEFKEAANESDTHLYLEALEEHGLVDIVLPALKESDPSSEEFAAKAKVLMDLVEHHIEEEESEMFPKARRALGATALKEIGQRLEARKQEILGETGMSEETGKSRRRRAA